MSLRENLGHIREYLTTPIPQRKLGDFLSSLPAQEPSKKPERITNKADIAARISTLPFQAVDLSTETSPQDDLARPFRDSRGNLWQIHSNNPRNMAITIANEKGTFTIVSFYTRSSSEEIKKEHAVLRSPTGKAIAAFTSQGDLIKITS